MTQECRINLDKVIELYKSKVAFYESQNTRGEYAVTVRELKYVVEILEALRSERPQGEWIPVSERLPEPQKPNKDIYNEHWSDFVLVCIEWWNGKKVMDTAFYDFDEGEWVYHGDNESEVIAWQPLPEPYEKGSAEE